LGVLVEIDPKMAGLKAAALIRTVFSTAPLSKKQSRTDDPFGRGVGVIATSHKSKFIPGRMAFVLIEGHPLSLSGLNRRRQRNTVKVGYVRS
jgi:hypothetical protein